MLYLFRTKKERNIVEYKCRRCKEGNVCKDCAIQLWTTNSQTKCPVCKNQTEGSITWYHSYDVEMGYIQPPQIQNNDDDVEQQEQQEQQEDNCPLIINCDNKILVSCIIVIGLFISFIVGTMYKVIDNQCAWNCGKYEDIGFTIMTSILFGFIILIAVIPFIVFFSIIIFGLMFEGLKNIAKFCMEKFNNYTRPYMNEDTRESCYACYKIIGSILFGLILSFCIGTLYRISNNICYWNCKEIDNIYTVAISTMFGSVILTFVLLSLCIIKSCFNCAYVIYNKLRNENNN